MYLIVLALSRYRSPHNSRVKEYMCEQLEVNGKEFTPHQVKSVTANVICNSVLEYFPILLKQFTGIMNHKDVFNLLIKSLKVEIVKGNKRKSRLAQGQ